jgi:hypothetical protein
MRVRIHFFVTLNESEIMNIKTLLSISAISALLCVNTFQKVSGQTSSSGNERIFVVYCTTDDKAEFEEYAQQFARLKPFGRVDVTINTPALKGDFECPAGSSDWHEYAAYNRSVEAFFPDNKLLPFVPADYISKNRQLLLSKVEILTDLGLSAAFSSNEPRYLPEQFFDKYPRMRGPRVDHPRRSVQKEFAPCFHQTETVEMYRNMVDQLYKNAPAIHTLYFSMNDAGSGTCWEDWLYSGPNGPADCKNINKSEAIVTMLNVYKQGAIKTGHDVDIYFKGMFTDAEMDDLVQKLPDKCYLAGRNYPPVRNISSMMGETYPVRGIIDPLEIIRTLSRKVNGQGIYIFDFWSSYSRAHDRIETITKIVDIVEDSFKNPVGEGDINVLAALKRFCDKWAGPEYSDQLLKAFVDLNRSMNENETALRGLSSLYWGVSTRQITRPLVFAPELLVPAEEKYFLPYIFNVSKDEARNDYMDIHGGNRELPPNATDKLVNSLINVAGSIEKIKNAPEQKFLEDMSMALRLYACVLRTCGNFNDAQIIRNRNKKVLAGPVHRPDKVPTWTGDQDLLDFNAIMRDELDNMQQMIDILEAGGINLISTSKQPFPEDTFILGPDLINQLRMKRKIMLAHWTDIEGYLSTPFK